MLNPQQTAAVQYIDGPLLVLAGAGSGKTSVITQKIAYLIETCGYAANSIVAVTFTNKAANEMRERVSSAIPAKSRRGLKVATFHTLGLHIIKKEPGLCGLKKGFTIFDHEDCQQVLKGLLPAGLANSKEDLFNIQQQISRWKNELLAPEVVKTNDDRPWAQQAAAIYPKYQQTLQAYNAVDFDDLIRLPVHLFQQYPHVLEYWQNKIRHLLIDEYQDSNSCQYAFVQNLVGIRASFTVVGDDDQSIYAWRGARPENLAQLQADYPNLKVIKLEQNYRSTGRILQTANQLIANNPHLFEKKLWSELGHGDLIRIVVCRDEHHEVEQVVMDMISHKLRHRTQFGDYAILYRGNHQARLFEKTLRHHSVPYHISGGQSWFSKAEVKDIFSYLKLICNPADDASFLRIINTPKRGIGDSTLTSLGHYAQSKGQSLYDCCDHIALQGLVNDKSRAQMHTFKSWLETIKNRCANESVVDVLKDMVDDTGYEGYLYEQSDAPLKAQKRMENVLELIDWVGRLMEKKPDSTLTDIVNKLILVDILEQAEEGDDERAQLMTLHASKGLEFPFVYLVGMEEELLPHRESIENDHIEEERRLAYVGITRAKKGLCMTLARQRRRGGALQDCLPSRFLEELPEDNIEWFGKSGVRDEQQSKALAKSHLDGLKSMLE
jgi:ATP-dependent DNA helicase Rep